LPFVENVGQSDPHVAYYAPTFAGTVFVTRDGELVYALPAPRAGTSWRAGAHGPGGGWTLTESFVEGRASPVAREPAPTHVSLFRGNDPARWQPQVATYADVDLGAVWPGIGVKLKAYGKRVEKVFTVEPGAAPETIRVRIAGAQRLTVAADGALAVHTGLGDVRLTPPVAYQEVAGTRQVVDAAYTLAGNEYGFRLAGYDPTRPVVIDPLLSATYLGGSNDDGARALAIAPTTGEVYVAGFASFTEFPGTSGGAQSASGGGADAFVARLNRARPSHLSRWQQRRCGPCPRDCADDGRGLRGGRHDFHQLPGHQQWRPERLRRRPIRGRLRRAAERELDRARSGHLPRRQRQR